MVDNPNRNLPKESLLKHFPEVFAEEVGQLDGEYHIKIGPTVSPVQHPPTKYLLQYVNSSKPSWAVWWNKTSFAPVMTPMPWVSSLVVVPKKDGKIRLCLDPKDLYQTIQREHYPLPTIEDIATHLDGAKVFTKLDVRNGFSDTSN